MEGTLSVAVPSEREVDHEAMPVIVSDWFRRARESQHVHYACGDHFSRRHVWFGVPTIALTTIVGTAVFASLATEAGVALKILVGMTSIVAAVLASLQTFLRYSDRAEKHKTAAAGYSAVRRRLELLTTFPPETADQWRESLEDIRVELDELAQTVPEVPEKIHKAQVAALKRREHKRIFHLPAEETHANI